MRTTLALFIGACAIATTTQADDFESLRPNNWHHAGGTPYVASPVFVGNDLFLRGTKHLYCISSE